MTSLLFPSGVIIIFLGAFFLFLVGVFAGSATMLSREKAIARSLSFLVGLVLSYLYYLLVIDLVFR